MLKGRLFSSPLGRRLSEVLKSGLTPHKLALTFCLGIAIGVLPILWGATILCAVCGHLFRLNHVALQAVNYLVYPLQIALFIPFCLLGQRLFPWGPAIPAELLPTLIHGHLTTSMHLIGWIAIKAITAWLVTAAPLAASLYFPFIMLFRRRFAAASD